MNRVANFGAGPSALPQPVLERIGEELMDFAGTGMSVMELSHRSEAYAGIQARAKEGLRRLLGGAPEHEILFMTGGARTQFSLVPMNLRPAGGRAGYLTTGRWSELALEAARAGGEAVEAYTSAASGFDRVPGPGDYAVAAGLAYLHFTSNNTIYGTQFHETPDGGGAPLICDASSDILGRPVDLAPYGLVYAGAQKNLGIAGVTLVLARRDMLERSPEKLPPTLSYARMAAKDSLLNTPPTFPIYVLGLVAEHLLAAGGLEAAAARNREKAELLYGAVDRSAGFYRGHAQGASRSLMNVTFRLPTPELEAGFLGEAARRRMVGLKGHRSVGGVRASIYNAAELTAVEALVELMEEFRSRRG